MNGSKFKKIISCLLTLTMIAVPFRVSLFSNNVEAAEIGMVGALPGDITLWEIFGTIFAGAGVIVANDNIQSTAAGHLGSQSFSLEEMESMGFIQIPTDGSSALDWDWSGLENQLRSDTSDDTKIIKGVFSQNGGTGSGGDDQDPWYKKAVNWVKYVVSQGKIKATEAISNGSDSIIYSLTSLAGMLGACFNKNVGTGLPIDSPTDNFSIDANFWLTADLYKTSVTPAQKLGEQHGQGILNGSVEDVKHFIFYEYNSSAKDYALYDFISNRSNSSANVQYSYSRNASVPDRSWNYNLNAKKRSNRLSLLGNMKSQSGIYNFRNYEICASSTDAINKADAWLTSTQEDLKVLHSPDIITPEGQAVIPNGSPSWVPTPYLQPNKEMEIIPQPRIDEFTQYVIEEMPEFTPAGEAWRETVNPYIENEPVPTPTSRPQPTQNPNVSPIPDVDPGGDENPITVTNPDPMPLIEGGYATTYGIIDYFPFCIPSDFVAAYKIFEVNNDARQAPYIDWNIKIDRFGIDEHIILDFSIFDSSAAVLRILIFISFCIGLLVMTNRLIWR